MTEKPQETTAFLESMFGWQPKDIGSMTFLTEQGADIPFAAICDEMEGITGWVHYFEVDNLEAATGRARENGARVIAENVKGPAGDASFLRDPGGSPMALWKRGQG
ncbi:MAG: VOC family protein [Pseudomonadota bacterium]